MEASIRPARPDDLAAIRAVFVANEGESNFPDDAIGAYLAHLIERGRVAVAEREGDAEGNTNAGAEGAAAGRIVAFGASVDTGRATHLADLFVLPQHHGGGLGRRLLETVFADDWPRTTFASDDPRALPIYVRSGMTPLWVNLYVSGDPATLPSPAVAYEVGDIAFEEMAEHERRWTGVDRGPDLAYWASNPRARAFAVRRTGAVVAVGSSRLRMNRNGHWLDHVQVAPDADPGPPLLAAMRDGAQGTRLVGACVPGPSPLLPVLLEAGFRIGDKDIYLASEPTLVDPARELVNTGIL
jgi:GNAT superfamily N-acetyltransferase